MHYEYSVIPAPSRSEKDKDAKTPADRYATTLTAELNRMADDGWEYIRADVLPSEERSGLTGRSTVYHNLLVFRRPAPAAVQKDAKTEYPFKAADSARDAAPANGSPDSAEKPAAS